MDERFKQTVNILIDQAYAEIDRKYGLDGLEPLAYHNMQHTQDIVRAADKMATKAIENGKLSERDKCLILIAAAYHDIEHSLADGENEAKSADIARQRMQEVGLFTETDTSKVVGAILGTKVYFEDGKLCQSAGDDLISQIVADADLWTLGSPSDVYWSNAKALFTEHFPDGKNKEDWARLQRSILTQHTYYTAEAAELFGHQSDNLARLQELSLA